MLDKGVDGFRSRRPVCDLDTVRIPSRHQFKQTELHFDATAVRLLKSLSARSVLVEHADEVHMAAISAVKPWQNGEYERSSLLRAGQLPDPSVYPRSQTAFPRSDDSQIEILFTAVERMELDTRFTGGLTIEPVNSHGDLDDGAAIPLLLLNSPVTPSAAVSWRAAS